MTVEETMRRTLALYEPPRPASLHCDEGEAGLGYEITRHGVHGRALLDQRRQRGMDLVMRLKDAEGACPAEVAFWAGVMVAMARETGLEWGSCSCPPGSGKRSYNLGINLARHVADGLGFPFFQVWENPTERGTRASIQSKLQERTTYRQVSEPPAGAVLVVDDAYCTGSTLARCVAASPHLELFWLTLARS